MGDKKSMAALLIGLKPHKVEDDKQEEDLGNDEGLTAAAEELIQGVNDKDADGVVEALKNAFSILDSMPHDEGEHTDEE